MPDQEQPGQPAAAAPATAAAGASGPGALRVSHEDRDLVAEALRVAAGDGRLTADELDERLGQALSARTYADLAPLVADLPGAGGALVPLPGPLSAALAGGGAPAPSRELVRIEARSGHARRDGRWAVPARMEVRVRSGHVELDFTQAVITRTALHIDAEVRSGTLLLVTRPGVTVDLDDVSVRSGAVRVEAPQDDNVPAFLHVTVSGSCRSGSITARPPKPPRAPRAPRAPRRSLWQWLRRAPRPRAVSA